MHDELEHGAPCPVFRRGPHRARPPRPLQPPVPTSKSWCWIVARQALARLRSRHRTAAGHYGSCHTKQSDGRPSTPLQLSEAIGTQCAFSRFVKRGSDAQAMHDARHRRRTHRQPL